jgi:hypothetical protein
MSDDAWKRLETEQIALKNELLQSYDKKKNDLKNQAKKNITALKYRIIDEIRTGSSISQETEELFNDVTDLLSTSGSEAGAEALRIARSELRDAIFPDYPYNFPQERRILQAFKVYHNCFEYAIKMQTVAWDKWLMKETRRSYQYKIDTLEDLYEKINQKNKKPTIREVE